MESGRNQTVGLVFTLTACLIASTARAQVSTGGVRGIVRDDTGAVLPGVAVAAREPRASAARRSRCSGQGMYRVEILPVGVTPHVTLPASSTVKQRGNPPRGRAARSSSIR